MGLHVELERFPVVVCRLVDAPGQRTAQEFADDLDRQCSSYLAELAGHRGLFVCVHDWTLAGELGTERWRIVLERAVLAAQLPARCVGQAIVVSSPALRGFATASALQQRMPHPVRVAATLEGALSWCTWQLRRSEPQAV
jgi:hypothetical protein